jgi:hypothetical protein
VDKTSDFVAYIEAVEVYKSLFYSSVHMHGTAEKKTPWLESVRELYRPSDRLLSAKLIPTFADSGVPRGQRDGSLLPYSRLSRPVYC